MALLVPAALAVARSVLVVRVVALWVLVVLAAALWVPAALAAAPLAQAAPADPAPAMATVERDLVPRAARNSKPPSFRSKS